MHWSLVQRGMWVHGAKSLGDYIGRWDGDDARGAGRAIRCPTLLTTAENDPLSQGAGRSSTIDLPEDPAAFTAAEGAGGHCEMANRSLANRRILDWLDAPPSGLDAGPRPRLSGRFPISGRQPSALPPDRAKRRRRPMSRRCELTGKGPRSATTSATPTTRPSALPAEPAEGDAASETLGQTQVPHLGHGLRTVDHGGGLDDFLAKAADAKLSPRALKLKRDDREVAGREV